MSKDNYPSIFSPQMATIVFIILQIFFATRAVLKIGEYLVNKPLQAAGMLADNVRGWEKNEHLSEKWTFGREAKLRGQMWHFEDNLSAKDIISQHTSKHVIDVRE